jgi:hypothetical protein
LLLSAIFKLLSGVSHAPALNEPTGDEVAGNFVRFSPQLTETKAKNLRVVIDRAVSRVAREIFVAASRHICRPVPLRMSAARHSCGKVRPGAGRIARGAFASPAASL